MLVYQRVPPRHHVICFYGIFHSINHPFWGSPIFRAGNIHIELFNTCHFSFRIQMECNAFGLPQFQETPIRLGIGKKNMKKTHDTKPAQGIPFSGIWITSTSSPNAPQGLAEAERAKVLKPLMRCFPGSKHNSLGRLAQWGFHQQTQGMHIYIYRYFRQIDR